MAEHAHHYVLCSEIFLCAGNSPVLFTIGLGTFDIVYCITERNMMLNAFCSGLRARYQNTQLHSFQEG